MYREAWRTPVVALDQKWDSDTRNGDDQKQNKEMSTPIKKFDVLVTQLSTVRYHLVQTVIFLHIKIKIVWPV